MIFRVISSDGSSSHLLKYLLVTCSVKNNVSLILSCKAPPDVCDRWKNALQKENMPWEQLVLKNGNEKNTLFKKYHLNGVPSTFLINKDGYVILINFQGDSLEKWLDSRFN